MPIPYLPTEIIAEIVSHLRSRVNQAVIENIPNGKAISLVCRRFFPVGQALRWRLVKISPSSIRSLAQHFEEFPHLAILVRLLHHDEQEEEEDVDAFRAESLDDLLLVLSSTSSLIRLDFNASVEENSSAAFTSIMQTASALPQLELFFFNIHGRVAWTLEVASAFNAGFPALRKMRAKFFHTLTLKDGVGALPPSTPRKKLEIFDVHIGGKAAPVAGFGTHLLQQLDPSTLLRCVIKGRLSQDVNYDFLSNCPRLKYLAIKFPGQIQVQSFSQLIEHLPKFRTLENLRFRAHNSSSRPRTIVEVNVPLKRVLAAFPASLKEFNIKHINFSDYEFIPSRQLPPSLNSKPVQLRAFDPMAEEITNVLSRGRMKRRKAVKCNGTVAKSRMTISEVAGKEKKVSSLSAASEFAEISFPSLRHSESCEEEEKGHCERS
ncbi:uncharacterized protein JCM6883_003674 [Sporobolomyces salmoneus]|uniref:uncharacterized protein n=1 Tax=Sporobolomyces salmoneus TaxID=183962 RepID=UPI0031706C53